MQSFARRVRIALSRKDCETIFRPRNWITTVVVNKVELEERGLELSPPEWLIIAHCASRLSLLVLLSSSFKHNAFKQCLSLSAFSHPYTPTLTDQNWPQCKWIGRPPDSSWVQFTPTEATEQDLLSLYTLHGRCDA
jgi:hypothetical protein